MASFLQNHGDIILDAVLTDYGRKLLAKGDGSFNIVKFAFGDDEIDYGLFDANAADTLNQDIKIMNTPILEAFTNNAASMKSQLLTLSLENLLYMPILKLASGKTESRIGKFGLNANTTYFEGYVIPVDKDDNQTTSAKLKTGTSVSDGYMFGVQSPMSIADRIIVHQGLDSAELDGTKSLQQENTQLYEESYSIYWDSRFCMLVDIENSSNTVLNTLTPLSVDDDGVATYKFTQQSVTNVNSAVTKIDSTTDQTSPILGTKGSQLQFKIVPNNNLKNSDNFFTKYGKTQILNPNFNSEQFKTIRSYIRVVGNTTGYSLEIPILFAKVQ